MALVGLKKLARDKLAVGSRPASSSASRARAAIKCGSSASLNCHSCHNPSRVASACCGCYGTATKAGAAVRHSDPDAHRRQLPLLRTIAALGTERQCNTRKGSEVDDKCSLTQKFALKYRQVSCVIWTLQPGDGSACWERKGACRIQ